MGAQSTSYIANHVADNTAPLQILQDFKQWLAKPVGHGPNKGKKYWKLLDDFRAERGASD